jgi:hypothetical protein
VGSQLHLGLRLLPVLPEQARYGAHGGGELALRAVREARDQGSGVHVGGGLQPRQRLGALAGEREDAAAAVGRVGAHFGEAAGGEFSQDAGEVGRVEPELRGDLRRGRPAFEMDGPGEEAALVGTVLRPRRAVADLEQYARLGQREGAVLEGFVQHADHAGVETVEAPDFGYQ